MLLLSNLGHTHELTAQSWLVTDEHGKIIAGENVDQVRSIASITKLITAITILNSGVDLHLPVKTPFGMVTRQQLLDMAIVRSNNRAADLLCELYPMGYGMCIADMNHTLFKLGLYYTTVYDATGLDRRNKSTARELSILVNEASKYPELVAASQQAKIKIKTKRKLFVFNNTNPLIGKRQDIVISKTGYTKPAGGCLAMLMSTDKGYRSVIVLGSTNTHTRIPDAEFIAENYQ